MHAVNTSKRISKMIWCRWDEFTDILVDGIIYLSDLLDKYQFICKLKGFGEFVLIQANEFSQIAFKLSSFRIHVPYVSICKGFR